jgi:hypothetical protein
MLDSGENSAPDVRYKDGRAFVQDPKTGWWIPQSAVAAGSSEPRDITVHRAGKVSGIDEATGLTIVDRSQPSEIPFSARWENLPPQTGTAGRCHPKLRLSVPGRQNSQTQTTPQGDDLSTKLTSAGLNGDEAKSILGMYGIDPRGTNASEGAEDAAGRPWEEQVQDAYTALAKQRGIHMSDMTSRPGDRWPVLAAARKLRGEEPILSLPARSNRFFNVLLIRTPRWWRIGSMHFHLEKVLGI